MNKEEKDGPPDLSVAGSNQVEQSGFLNPPKVPLVLRIGVTGHRVEKENLHKNKRKRSKPDITAIRNSIREILEVIRDTFKGVAETHRDLFDLLTPSDAHPGGGTLRIISALAAGADQWVAGEALSYHFELQTVLPFKRDEYLKDFNPPSEDAEIYTNLLSKATAILELDGIVRYDANRNRNPDSHSYENVGRVLLNQTDLLIAIWDGEEAHGRGGAGQIVQEALQKGIPVVWIPWNTPQKWQLSLTTSSWRIFEKMADLEGDSDRLSELVEKLLLPPDEKQNNRTKAEKSLRNSYFNEKQKRGNPLLGIWLFLRNLVCGEIIGINTLFKTLKAFLVSDFEMEEEKKSVKFWDFSSGGEPLKFAIPKYLQTWINERYTHHYAWANGLSIFYGNMHRSAFVLNYLLGALAVFLALICLASGIEGKSQTLWILAELAVILGILCLTYLGRKKQWHQRWIDYRTLAEYLRISRCMILFGGGIPRVVYDAHLDSYGNPSQTWMNWHYRAIERSAGVPTAHFSKGYLQSCQEIWYQRLVKDQIDYHKDAFRRFNLMDKSLHWIGDMLFIGTLIACVLHLAHIWLTGNARFDWLNENMSGWMTLLCAFLPALGAAFAAIRSNGELLRLAQRSEAMEDNLKGLQLKIAKVPVDGALLNSVSLRYQVDRVSDLMTNEMLDWRVVFQDRPLGLPV